MDANTPDGSFIDASGAGAGDASQADAAAPFACTSTAYWTGGERSSALMSPGRACLTCHATVSEDDVTLVMNSDGRHYVEKKRAEG